MTSSDIPHDEANPSDIIMMLWSLTPNVLDGGRTEEITTCNEQDNTDYDDRRSPSRLGQLRLYAYSEF